MVVGQESKTSSQHAAKSIAMYSFRSFVRCFIQHMFGGARAQKKTKVLASIGNNHVPLCQPCLPYQLSELLLVANWPERNENRL